MMWGGGDGSSDVTRGSAPSSGPIDSMPGGAGAAGAIGAAGAMGRGNTEASNEGSAGPDVPLPPPGMGNAGEEAARGGEYGEELGRGQDGWEHDTNTLNGEEVMDDPFEPDADSDDGFFGDWGGGGGGGGGGGDWGGDAGDWF